MTTYVFTVKCTDGKTRKVTATAERLQQATSNMLRALLDAGLEADVDVPWTHVQVINPYGRVVG